MASPVFLRRVGSLDSGHRNLSNQFSPSHAATDENDRPINSADPNVETLSLTRRIPARKFGATIVPDES
jgi:hypothetical protein